jgi:crotonobetaine/carnitine-CoA ligase
VNEPSISEILSDPRIGDGGTYPDLVRHMATYDSNLVAIEWPGGSVSYGQLLSMVAAEAEYLTDLGVGPGDVVASMVTGHPYSLANHMAVALIGGLSAPVYVETEGNVLATTLNAFRAKVVLAMPEAVQRAEAVLGSVPTLEHVVPMVDSEFDRIMQEGRDIGPWLESAHPDPADPCLLLTTSGTTGTPKVVTFSQSLASSGFVMARKWGFGGIPKIYITTSWGHGAVTWQVAIAFWLGGSVVLPDRFSASGFWDDVRQHRCTHALLFGPMAQAVFNKLHSSGIDIPEGLDFTMISAGLPIHIWDRLSAAGVKVYEVYSATEIFGAAGTCLIMSNPDGRYQRGSIGRPWREHEARLVDDEGREVPEGEIGELQMKPVGAPGVVKYFNIATPDDLVVDGWVRTGDNLYKKNGDYFFVARKRDIIRRRGINMSPGSIEDQFLLHPGVDTAVALAVPSALGEDDVKVVAKPAAGITLTSEELASYADEHLPRHMRPRYIEVMDDIPVTQGSGRPKRAQLERTWVTESTWDTEENRYLQPEEAPTGARS